MENIAYKNIQKRHSKRLPYVLSSDEYWNKIQRKIYDLKINKYYKLMISLFLMFVFKLLKIKNICNEIANDTVKIERCFKDSLLIRLLDRDSFIHKSYTALLDDLPPNFSIIDRISSLIMASLILHQKIKDGIIEKDSYRDTFLDMTQYKNLFSFSIIPGIFKDKQVVIHKSDYVIIMINGDVYKLKVIENNEIINFNKIKKKISKIYSMYDEYKGCSSDTGLLSASNRKTCAIMRMKMLLNKRNKEFLKIIDYALFAVCLDLKYESNTIAETIKNAHSANYKNRWYNKCFQIIMMSSGKASLMFSFVAGIDGSIGMQFASKIQAESIRILRENICDTVENTFNSIRKISYNVPVKYFIKAERSILPYILDDPLVYEINNIGKAFFKKFDASPDSSFQVALHLAIAEFFSNPIQVNHFVSLRKYYLGALNCPMVTTDEILKFVTAASNIHNDSEYVKKLLIQAINSHKEITNIHEHYLSWSELLNLVYVKSIYNKFLISLLYVSPVKNIFFGEARQIITSHIPPAKGVTLIGRSGIRLPNVPIFGLHYMLFDDNIKLIAMPGKNWIVKHNSWNKEIFTFIQLLEEKLVLIKNIIST